MRQHNGRVLQIAALTALAQMGIVSVGFGQTFKSTSGTPSWNLNTNWTPTGVPNGAGASATFLSPTSTLTVNLNGALTAGSIAIPNNHATAIFSIANGTSGSLKLKSSNGSGTSITVDGTNSTAGNVTFGASLTLDETLTLTNNNIAAADNRGAVYINGTMGGVGGFTKTGAGTVSFNGSLTKAYEGATVVQQGRLRMSRSNIPAKTSSITVNDGGSLYLDDTPLAWTLGLDASTLITLNGEGPDSAGALRHGTSGSVNTSRLNNPVLLGSNSRIHVELGTTLALSGGVSGSSTLTKAGPGTLNMRVGNTELTGGTKIVEGDVLVDDGSRIGTGTLRLAQAKDVNTSVTFNNATQSIGTLSSAWTNTVGTQSQTISLNGTVLTINQATDTTFGNGEVSTLTGQITGTGSIIKSGPGTLTLSGANSYTGTTTVSQGSLIVTGSLARNNSASVSVASIGTTLTGAPSVTRATSGAGSYAGLGATEVGGLATKVDLLAGGNTSGTDTGVTMQFRQRKPAELPGSGLVYSDVLSLTGMVNTNTSSTADVFVVQMSYSEAEILSALGLSDSTAQAAGLLTLGTLNAQGKWALATSLNTSLTGPSPTVFSNYTGTKSGNPGGSYASFAADKGVTNSNLATFLGSWGVDTSNNVAWAVVNHNSEFAVIPEPTSAVGIMTMAGLGILRRRRR